MEEKWNCVLLYDLLLYVLINPVYDRCTPLWGRGSWAFTPSFCIFASLCNSGVRSVGSPRTVTKQSLIAHGHMLMIWSWRDGLLMVSALCSQSQCRKIKSPPYRPWMACVQCKGG